MIVRKPSETYPFLDYRYDTTIIDLIITMIIIESICRVDDYLYI
jgi:hypothetical protein